MLLLNMGLTVQTIFLIIILQLVHHSEADTLDTGKRVPQGFVGMRGKKYFDYDDTSPYDKRRNQGFVGVKGKKDFLNYLASFYRPYDNPYSYLKRAPVGFMGMRGKKDEYSEIGGYIKRAPVGFIGMRGKKDEYPEIGDNDNVPNRGSILGQIDYVSGKEDDLKSDQFTLLNELIKKYAMLNQDSENEPYQMYTNDINDLEKTNDSSNEIGGSGSSELTKRAAQMNQFFGMRGKKSDRVGYRGNKRPFDLSFRGKFVGVRGKKSDLSSIDHAKIMADPVGGWSKRKGPGSGFFGMRGKKWIDPDFSSNEASAI